ncbi:Transcription factor Adf-1 [Liparis tanakae]|uniref:Transcription factor Adf-1 n=1 Tax=Liparis tanakae TaxID=230148 RepID=A0A4Z2HIQ5_9TELE|nr:Transcription factor Adf-1 [Liparis tanakae]
MEHKLILAVSGFPSIYDTNAPSYRDLNMRAESWRHVLEIIAVPESECRRKWKMLRDQHRRERQREKDRRESGMGLSNYRPWRYSSSLAFLNPFIDARAAAAAGLWTRSPRTQGAEAGAEGRCGAVPPQPGAGQCRRKWKMLRDQHCRERQREKDRRESGMGLFNYRPWRHSSSLSFLNPFIDTTAAGCSGWALYE